MRGLAGLLARAADGLVAAVAPVAQARRDAARIASSHARYFTSAFDGAKGSRSWKNRATSSGSADADLDEDTLASLRERSRDRDRNDPIARACIQSYVDNIVGTGFRPRLRLDAEELGITQEKADDLGKQAKRIWERWGLTCDSGNRLTIEEIQTQVMAQCAVNGDVGVLPLMIQDARVPSDFELKLEIIEGDRIDTPVGITKPNIRLGVELGKRSQPIAYWVSQAHPGDEIRTGASVIGTRTFKRIPAHTKDGQPRFIHVYAQERPGQSRGRPMLSIVLDRLKDRDDYLEAELIAAQVGACFAAFVTKADPFGALAQRTTSDTTGSAEKEEELSPGAIYYLGPGESVDFGNPTRPNAGAGGFLDTITREICSALGMPFEIATKDFTGSNYSNTRAALIEARRMFQRRQRWLINQFLHVVWMMLLEEAWLKGEFDAGDFSDRRHAWTRTHWQPPAFGWVDPQKEIMAWESMLEMGVATRQEMLDTRNGADFEDITKQLADEEEIRERHGLVAAPAEPPDPPTDDSEGEGETDGEENPGESDEDDSDSGEETEAETKEPEEAVAQ